MIEPQSEHAGASSWPWNVILAWPVSTGNGCVGIAVGADPAAGACVPAAGDSAELGSLTGLTLRSRRTSPTASCEVSLRNFEASQRKM